MMARGFVCRTLPLVSRELQRKGVLHRQRKGVLTMTATETRPAQPKGPRSVRTPHTLETLREEVEDCDGLGMLPAVSTAEGSTGTDPAARADAVHARLEAIWRDGAAESAALARRHRLLAPLWIEPSTETSMDASDEVALLLAHALRTTVTVAQRQLCDAHTAVEHFPRTLELLAAATMPARWFNQMLRRSIDLEESALERLDEIVAAWPMTMSEERFRRELGLMLRWLRDQTTGPPPEPDRCVELLSASEAEGTGCLQVTGPIPEIVALGRRLDQAARAVQGAQRRALRDGAEEIPFDDGSLKDRRRAFSLGRLRYEILTRTVLETDPVAVPADRFRINVVVPVMTLLGVSDAPGDLEGGIPIPATMARSLAGNNPDWCRILADPHSGAFPPLPPERYSPTPAQLEYLRLRNETCAVPGCTRPSSVASEADHIIEFDHDDPTRGGRTKVENLHLLCWRHHQMKTRGIIDPVREDPPPASSPPPATSPPPGADPPTGTDPLVLTPTTPGRTRWEVPGARSTIEAEDAHDLFTPMIVEELQSAWTGFERHVELLRKRKQAAEEAARRRAEKAAAEAKEAARMAAHREAVKKAKAEGRTPPPPPEPPKPPPPPSRDDPEAWGPEGPPPF